MLLPLAAALLLAAPRQDAPDLQAALAEAVDVPRPGERLRAAASLARRTDVTLEQWVEACRAFAPRGEVTPGQRVEQVELYADGDMELTPLAIHVPESYRPDAPAPLLMAFHWTGGGGEQVVRSWISTADELGMLVCAPSETSDNDGYHFTRRELDVTRSALRWMRREFNVDENRVFATGISRGGHLTWDLALRFPDLLAGAAPMIGGPYWDVRSGRANLRYLENLVHLPLRGLQGAKDQEGLVWNVRYAFEQLAELGATDAVYHEFPDLGHSMDVGAVDWVDFFGTRRRDPRPAEIVRRFAREGEGRAFWVEVLEGKKDVVEEFTPTISASLNKKLDDAGRRRWLIDETEERTARLWARFVKPNRIEVKQKDVKAFRLLLTADMFDEEGTFEVKVGNRRRKPEVTPDAMTLLSEFVERFDRTFLPVAEVEIRL